MDNVTLCPNLKDATLFHVDQSFCPNLQKQDMRHFVVVLYWVAPATVKSYLNQFIIIIVIFFVRLQF